MHMMGPLQLIVVVPLLFALVAGFVFLVRFLIGGKKKDDVSDWDKK